jgi:type VI protein secretion system component VasK
VIGDSLWNYAHGQIFESRLQWSPASSIPKVEMEVEALNGEVQKLSYQGSWALLRWANQAQQTAMADTSKVLLDFATLHGSIQLMLIADGMQNPINSQLYDNLCIY